MINKDPGTLGLGYGDLGVLDAETRRYFPASPSPRVSASKTPASSRSEIPRLHIISLNLPFKKQVLICVGPHCGGRRGSSKIRSAFRQEILIRRLQDEIKETQCICFGLCNFGPNVVIYPDGIWYYGVTPEDVPEIIGDHLIGGKIIQRLLFNESV